VEISCAFPTTLDSPEHVAIAEELGFERAWLYDTPQQSPDVWMTLALAADRTERIGLGPGVLVPTLRHPMVNAAGTAALVALAPDRVVVGFGTGFTGRRAMGYRAIPWAYVASYIRAYQGLLRGETIEWEGARMRMLHPSGHAAPRPVEVPIIVAALGPKGHGVALELGDGIFVTQSVPDFVREHSWVSYLFWGTVLDEGEDSSSARVRAAAGPGLALAYHGSYEFDTPLSDLPGGEVWQATIDRTPPEDRHLAVHVEHCVGLNEADQEAWEAGGNTMLEQATVSGSPEQVRQRLGELAAQGVTELVYQPSGPDIRRELERFMDIARAAVTASRSA
jgi:5,10-methylenetetrahydromethanopterin reductase